MKGDGGNIQIPRKICSAVLATVKHSDSAVMIFGSVARGDDFEISDIDVLELADRRCAPYRRKRINVSVYNESKLREMSERGSLFVLHLRREGIIIRDNLGKLASCLSAYKEPPSYEPYLQALRDVANLLDASKNEYSKRWKAYNEIAIFVLRSTVYAKLAESGEPLFSLTAINDKMSRKDVSDAFSLKYASKPDYTLFKSTCTLISEFLLTNIENKGESIEAYITNEGENNPLILSLGLRLLGKNNFKLSYDMLTVPAF